MSRSHIKVRVHASHPTHELQARGTKRSSKPPLGLSGTVRQQSRACKCRVTKSRGLARKALALPVIRISSAPDDTSSCASRFELPVVGDKPLSGVVSLLTSGPPAPGHWPLPDCRPSVDKSRSDLTEPFQSRHLQERCPR